ncbi:hypothetical protein PanWU01x14_361580 [Parasponia andersonii]|uniref:Uncharacterized protein n=1 Tax=Parasponia andersonii TaxID=3476 RepID=A0A2P5A791_PARAD|nr:hypothetical protein PanWU01x14_361580 [Parasponia andersonii]
MPMDRVMKIQNRVQINCFSEKIFPEETNVLAALDNALTLYDSFLRDKCRIHWLEGADHNSYFYYVTLKKRKVNKPLSSLIINDEIVTNPDHITAYAVDFYVSLFSEPNHSPIYFAIIREHIPTLVTDHDNAYLMSLPLE